VSRVWFKKGVSLKNLQPQTVWAMERAREVFASRGLNCIYTSIYRQQVEGEKFSLHPLGRAFDCDTDHDISVAVWGVIADELAVILGDEFDVLAHDAGSGFHIHAEFDPK